MYRIKFTVILLITLVIQLGCEQKKDKWSAANFEIKKHPSIRYSEIVSGKLDSAEKAEHELVKKIKSKEKNTSTASKKNIFIKLYNWFVNK
tara:strand:+ start:2599 stop:2871 length:273 start_codon:yes stop_codon:yes gene_type:complete